MSGLNVLVLGAAYGLLPAVRILLAGHRVTVVCRAHEREELASGGAEITFQRRDGSPGRRIRARAEIGASRDGVLGLSGPEASLDGVDLVFLAMSEPHYSAPDISSLMRRIAVAGLPVVSLMNMPPPSFLRQLGTIDVDQLAPAYSSWDVWQCLDPNLTTAASPDAQAVRSDPAKPNMLTVTLGSNFKIAPFTRPEHQAMLNQISRDVSAFRPDGAPLTVRILAQASLHVPLAKWPMLIAGNCRCLQASGNLISICDAVHENVRSSGRIYDWVVDLIRSTGASDADIVPFARYATAAKALSRPSSFGRALASEAPTVERVDKMVQLAARSLGRRNPDLDAITEMVDARIAAGRG